MTNKIWVCLACGKRSRDQHGSDPIDKGYDVSCVLGSVEVAEDRVVLGEDGRVKEIL